MLDDALPYLRRKRTLLCCPLPRTLGDHTNFPSYLSPPSAAGGPHLAGAHRPRLFPNLRDEEHHQHRPVVESFQNSGRGRSGREGEGEGGGKIRQGLRVSLHLLPYTPAFVLVFPLFKVFFLKLFFSP